MACPNVNGVNCIRITGDVGRGCVRCGSQSNSIRFGTMSECQLHCRYQNVESRRHRQRTDGFAFRDGHNETHRTTYQHYQLLRVRPYLKSAVHSQTHVQLIREDLEGNIKSSPLALTIPKCLSRFHPGFINSFSSFNFPPIFSVPLNFKKHERNHVYIVLSTGSRKSGHSVRRALRAFRVTMVPDSVR